MKKWIEVNIHISNSNQFRRTILSFVKPFVRNCKKKHHVDSWHFFVEKCPSNGPRPNEPEIRLRFYAESTEVDIIKNELDSRLKKLARLQGPITFHHFGKHGGPGKYRGEAGNWKKDWSVVMKQFNYGSEYALLFLSKQSLHKPIGYHGQRYAHLLLNQLLIPHGGASITRTGRVFVDIMIPQ